MLFRLMFIPHSAFRIPHSDRTFVLSYLRTPLMREAFQLASLLAYVRGTLDLEPFVHSAFRIPHSALGKDLAH